MLDYFHRAGEPHAPGSAFSYAKTDTVTVTRTSDGLTEQSMGATEGCTRFNLDELVDAGLGHYRLWTGMSRLEGDMRSIPTCCRSCACSS